MVSPAWPCRLTYQLSGRPGAYEYAPHVRSRSECARLRLTRTGHGPLQRKLDPPAAMARPPVGTPPAACEFQPAPRADKRSRHGIAAALIEAGLNIRMSMRLPLPADNLLGVDLGRVARSSYTTGSLTEAGCVVEPSSATCRRHQIFRRRCRCLTYQLSGRPTEMNVCPACACAAVAHARTATEAVHGPLQRKLGVQPSLT